MERLCVPLANKWNTTSHATGKSGLFSLAESKAKKMELKAIHKANLGGPDLERMQRLEVLSSNSSSLGIVKRKEE